MSKKQDVKLDDLVAIKAITENQKIAFEAYKQQKKNFWQITLT